MNISDTFYVALCMTILIIGVVYWFWTQNQYIQRKLNLLENIVYEMKTSLNNIPGPSDESPPEEPVKPNYPPPPSSELGEDEDLLHEELHAEVLDQPANTDSFEEERQTQQLLQKQQHQQQHQQLLQSQQELLMQQQQQQMFLQKQTTPLPKVPEEPLELSNDFHEELVGKEKEKEKEKENDTMGNEPIVDDLQPGGVGSSIPIEITPDTATKGSSLDLMTLKELKRLAEQRKIVGASSMRKQALIDALRGNVPQHPFENAEGSITLS